MKRLLSVLREKRGMTLIEMVVGAGLLCVVIGIFSASLRPAAEVTRRTQELNSAELITDDLLETIRGEVETAVGSIQCYADKDSIQGQTGSDTGKVIEFQNEKDLYVLLGADGCPATQVVAGSSASTDMDAIAAGYLSERYYKPITAGGYYYADADGKPVARGVAMVYPKGFYMGLHAGTSFAIDDTNHTVTATVTIYRGSDDNTADWTELFSDSQVIDLRYQTPLKMRVNAKQPSATDG